MVEIVNALVQQVPHLMQQKRLMSGIDSQTAYCSAICTNALGTLVCTSTMPVTFASPF